MNAGLPAVLDYNSRKYIWGVGFAYAAKTNGRKGDRSMSFHPRIEGLNDVVRWRDLFLVLALKRNQSILPDVGVPAEIAMSPGALLKTARQYLLAVKRLKLRDSDEFTRSIQVLVDHAYTNISNDYGAEPARGLYHWAQRHFTNRLERNRWWIWSMLLPALADNHEHRLLKSMPSLLVPAPRVTRLVAMIRSRFNPDITRRNSQLTTDAYEIPLTPIEKEWVDLDAREPGDLTETDTLALLEEALGNQRAYEFSQELDTWLEPSEREMVLEWARDLAARRGIPTELVTLPERLST